jgi:nitronate monooxygenase
MSSSQPLHSTFPWTSPPLLANAPMGGFAGPRLASAVSLAGGLGLIGALDDPGVLDKQLQETQELLGTGREEGMVEAGIEGRLPVGVGLLLFLLRSEEKRKKMLEVLARWRVSVVWLFAEVDLGDYVSWVKEVRKACGEGVQVWIQTCSVGAALELTREAKPDVLVMQGSDAGGHGWERGAGVVSLVPETRDALDREGLYEVKVAASGGLVDARGVAAALSLGAEGVVMGTRFLASEEVNAHSAYKQQVLEGRDGGQYTIRAKLFDELKGKNIWPGQYDGRGVVSQSFKDFKDGVGIDEIRKRHKDAVSEESDMGWGQSKRAVVWSGTGVGMVSQIQPAGDIVREVREAVSKRLDEARSKL